MSVSFFVFRQITESVTSMQYRQFFHRCDLSLDRIYGPRRDMGDVFEFGSE